MAGIMKRRRRRNKVQRAREARYSTCYVFGPVSRRWITQIQPRETRVFADGVVDSTRSHVARAHRLSDSRPRFTLTRATRRRQSSPCQRSQSVVNFSQWFRYSGDRIGDES